MQLAVPFGDFACECSARNSWGEYWGEMGYFRQGNLELKWQIFCLVPSSVASSMTLTTHVVI